MESSTPHRHYPALIVAVVGLVGVALVTATMMLGRSGAAWGEGEERGQFRAVFNGHGTITGDDDEIVLEPNEAADRDITHGALVVTTEDYQDLEAQVQVQTEEQLRDGEPNPWEAGWVLWNYTDNDHFYAVALKPNGWEISKQDPAYPGKQRFLASGSDPSFPIGTKHTVNVTHRGAEMTVSVDGEILDTVVDEERPYRQGAVGFYTEDARVSFTNLSVTTIEEGAKS